MSEIYFDELRKAIDALPFGVSYKMYIALYQALEENIEKKPFVAAEILGAIIQIADSEGHYQIAHEATMMWRGYELMQGAKA